MWSGDLVDALRLTTDGKPQAKVGGAGGALQTLEPSDGDPVVRTWGYATGLINQLGFECESGRTMVGGKDEGQAKRRFTVEPPPENLWTRMTGLSGQALTGSQTTDNIKALTFHWYCALRCDFDEEA